MGAYLLFPYRNMVKAPWYPPFLRFANAASRKHSMYDFSKSSRLWNFGVTSELLSLRIALFAFFVSIIFAYFTLVLTSHAW